MEYMLTLIYPIEPAMFFPLFFLPVQRLYFKMSSISPVSSDPEKTAYGHDAPVYVTDEGVGQVIEVEEFGETKELR